MLLSIIIPCYRVAPYLAACLDSVCCLPPSDVEILCVDDACPEESGAIAAAYAARHAHLRVLTHAENRGLSAARNTGLAQAQGEYILFLDGDDLLCADALPSLLAQASTGALDMLQAAYACFEDGTGRPLPTPSMPAPTPVLTGDACFAAQCAAGRFEPLTVIRLYRRAFLDAHQLRMAEGFLFEDELFTAPAFLLAERVQVSDALLYRYRRRPGSIMDGFRASVDWCTHYLRIVKRLMAQSDTAHPTPGHRALRRRAVAIALSIPKNIAAYRLTGAVRLQALAFVRAHRAQILRWALRFGSPAQRAQALLLRCSLGLFLRLYERLRPAE